MKEHKHILDLASTEMVRSSFCFLPYLLAEGDDSCIWHVWDDCSYLTARNAIKKDVPNNMIISVWSESQMLIAATLLRDHELDMSRVRFIGYTPYLKALKVPIYRIEDKVLMKGMARMPLSQRPGLLVSDADLHLSNEGTGIPIPFFTSYGCPNSCSFCPATIEQPRRVTLPVSAVHRTLEQLPAGNRLVHFADEDFFADTRRAACILSKANRLGIKSIALACVESYYKFLTTVPNAEALLRKMVLVEIGLETISASLRKDMHKRKALEGISTTEKLSAFSPVPIFWFALSFFPGETLDTLNSTGRFLEKHGLLPEDLTLRIRTNANVLGLGQFFMPYPGTKGVEKALKEGRVINKHPSRLIPSYIPNSLLQSVIKVTKSDEHTRYQYLKGCALYKVDGCNDWENFNGLEVESYLYVDGKLDLDRLYRIALAARVGLVSGKQDIASIS